MKIRVTAALLTLALLASLPWEAAAIYKGDDYIYDDWGNSVYAPGAYEAAEILDGDRLGCGAFSKPQDLLTAADGRVYIADQGNGRIVVLTPDLTLDRVINGYVDGGETAAFAEPAGLYLSPEGHLYVCDSASGRVLVLDEENRLIRTLEKPDTDLLDKDTVFRPIRVVADTTGTTYVACYGIYQGLIAYDEQGQFSGFFGANQVEVTMEVLLS